MDNSPEIYRVLGEMDIPHQVFFHEPKWTIEDCLRTPELDLTRATMPKNVFLCNRQQTDYYLLLLMPARDFRTSVVSKLLGVSRLSFAPLEKLPGMLGLESGAVSPLGLLFDREKRVTLVVDDALLAYRSLWFHPCVNTASVEMRTTDFLERFLPDIGVACRMIHIPSPEGV
ncbi:MAG: prolyl-tRNA synthetase associated domain-containing protein [Clostridiales bacterium]|nr:prolyl-tRNA synthetase associated domain-containing protein [Clostridiales bacterium]